MGYPFNRLLRRGSTAALLAALLAAGPAAAGDAADSQAAEAKPESDKAAVVPYETRAAPSHRVSLRDDRVYFLKKLEETEGGFVLHTMEDETIEVEQSDVTEIVEFKTQ